jgi:putative ATP-dependent endonuclease of OLD family
MRIQRLIIHNYRSIRDLEMECQPFVTLLGPNNHGKSNLLAALEFFFSTSVKPVEQDFFINRNKEENDLWVEITFNELTEQEKNTFKKYVQSSKTICIRKTSLIQNGGIEVFYNGYVEQPDLEWLRSDKAGDYTSRDSVNKTPLKDFIQPDGRLAKADVERAQQSYIEQNRDNLKFSRALEEGPLLGSKNVAGGVLPDFYLIPAVRDLTDEIKVKTTTTFGRLLSRAVREMAEKDPRFREARQQLESVVESLNVRDATGQEKNRLADLERSIQEELQTWNVTVNIEVTPPELERLFELGTDIHLDDGVRTTADRKGHGLQRAIMFALLRAWAKSLREERSSEDQEGSAPRRQSDSVIFAMEEPELFLHPHAQRGLAKTLREIAATLEHQVFICTHSTHFVNLEHYKEVAIITKHSPEKGSCVRQCVKELFEGDDTDERKKRFHMAQWINPDRGEMFFAKRVVFVEGETEKVMLPFLAQKLDVIDPDISIIDCGSKHNLPLYITIAKAFEIPYLVIHDEDPLPNPIPAEWNQDKINASKRTLELNGHIKNLVEAPLGQVEMLSPDFETVSGVSKSQGETKGKALAALDHFEAVEQSKIPERLRQVVCAAFNAQGEQG